jgi:hypothetical protein
VTIEFVFYKNIFRTISCQCGIRFQHLQQMQKVKALSEQYVQPMPLLLTLPTAAANAKHKELLSIVY